MKTEISNYIAAFESIYNGEPFYGKALMTIMHEADTNKVYQKNSAAAHSAYEIASHLFAWRNLFVKKLNGDIKSSIEQDSKEDWPPLLQQQTAEAWNQLIQQLEQNQQQLLAVLAKYDDASLNKNVAGASYSLRTYLEGQMQHDIYHIGQIALALKNA